MSDDATSLADRMRAAQIAAGRNPDRRPATAHEIARARAVKDEATPGTNDYILREERLAEIEDRRPRHRQGL